MRILITGGLGYIGSHLVCELLNNKHQIHILDDLSNSELNVLNVICEITQRPDLIRFYHLSLLDKKSISQIFKDNDVFDICYHLGQMIYSNYSVDNPLNVYKNNLESTLNLLECIKNNHCKKFIYLSPAGVFSVQKANVSETESRGQNLNNPMLRSFYFTEEILQDFSIANPDIKIIIFRLQNIFGRHSSLKLLHSSNHNMFHKILEHYKNEKTIIKIHGKDYPNKDKTPIKGYIHILDLCNVLSLLIDQELTTNFSDFNIGLGYGISDLELINIASKVFDKELKFILKKRKNGVEKEFFLNTSKINYCFSWKPTWTFEKAFLLEI